MANFEEIKKIAIDAAETIADKSYEFYKVAEEKTKVVAKLAKLNADATRTKGALKRLYAELGVQYFDSCDQPPEELNQLFEEIKASKEALDALKAEIADIKSASQCDCGCCDECDDIEIEIIQEGEEAAKEASEAGEDKPEE